MDLLVLEVLSKALHLVQLPSQVLLVSQQPVQLAPEVVDVSLKEGLNVVSDCFVPLFLQKGPFSLQDLVLLLKESDLDRERRCFTNSDFRMVLLREERSNPAC